jgi:hypothetical protein
VKKVDEQKIRRKEIRRDVLGREKVALENENVVDKYFGKT